MKTVAWADLPNAKYIDWVFKSANEYPEKWCTAYSTTFTGNSELNKNAWLAVQTSLNYREREAARADAGFAIQNIVCASLWNYTRDAVWDSIVALVAYDDSGYMIESEVGELELIAAFGDERAILLLPACIVFNETKVLTNTANML